MMRMFNRPCICFHSFTLKQKSDSSTFYRHLTVWTARFPATRSFAGNRLRETNSVGMAHQQPARSVRTRHIPDPYGGFGFFDRPIVRP